jgi:hypothetical protein
MDIKRIIDVWDRKVNLNNKPVLTNRDIEVISKTQELFNITIGDAISGLMRGLYSYDEVLELLREEGYPRI